MADIAKMNTTTANAENQVPLKNLKMPVGDRVALKDAKLVAADRVALKDLGAKNQKAADKTKTKRAGLKTISNNQIGANKAEKKASRPGKKAKDKESKKSKENPSTKQVGPTKAKEVNVPAASDNAMDFVIFCDENDELAVTAVQVEKKPEGKKDTTCLNKENAAEKLSKKVETALQEKANVAPKENVIQKVALTTNENSKPVERKALRPRENVEKQQQASQVVQPKPKQPVETKVVEKKSQVIKDIVTKSKEEVKVIEELTDSEMKEADMSLITQTDSLFDELKLDETIVHDIPISPEGSLIYEDEDKENDPSIMISETPIPPRRMTLDVINFENCVDYAGDIYKYLIQREKRFMPLPTYMDKQQEINSKMRSMLVDWLVDVAVEYQLQNETVFLAVNYIDRYLSTSSITLQNFQLLGTTALFVAAKYEEIYPPDISEFIYVTDDAYTKQQMLGMEKLLLKSLEFEVSPPTIHYFLTKYLTTLSVPSYVAHLAEFLCHLTLLQQEPFVHFHPSDIAITAIILALHTYTCEDVVIMDDFIELIKYHTHVDEDGELCDAVANEERQACMSALYHMQKIAESYPQKAVYLKYSQEKYLKVAQVEIAEEIPSIEDILN